MKPIVAIIGRPNVGKSTLFNTIVRKKIAIVDDLPGVTRDRNYADAGRGESVFTLVDTGGFDTSTQDDLAHLIKEHAHMAVEEADVIIFLMDAREGLLSGDQEIARILQRSGKPVLYCVNKVENRKTEDNIADFYRLGADAVFSISAKNRIGISDLLDEVFKHIPECNEKDGSQDEVVVSIIGRPNVGKSSLINKILGRERLVVSDKAGTTRDPVDSLIRYNNKTIRFIDTAGIRRKSRISYRLEKYCVFQALRCISRSSFCIFMIDAAEGVTAQDVKLAALIHDSYRACILVVNKWDTIKKDDKTHDKFIKKIRSQLPFIDFAPLVVVSALTGLRVRKILDIIEEVGITYEKRVPTPQLNRELQSIYGGRMPPRSRGTTTRIYYATQVSTRPPIFKLFTNNPKAFSRPYKKYLERSIRERFGFERSPVCLQFAKKSKDKKGGSRP